MPEFEAAGIAVFALSYDEAIALEDFRAAHGITFTLLSDPESAVIRAFGILNTLIDSSDHPWFGIPYPGAYVVDAEGTITHKFFDSNLAVRAGPEQLLRAVTKRSKEAMAVTSQTPTPTAGDVQMTIAFDGDHLTAVVQRDLVVQLEIPEGKHVYAAPAPAGSVAVDVILDNNNALVARSLQRPKATPHALSGSGEEFLVHQGSIELRLPLTMNAADDLKPLQLSGEVCWQSCDDEVCDLPVRERFLLTIPVAAPPAMALQGPGAEIEPNAMGHFQYMTKRREDPQPQSEQ